MKLSKYSIDIEISSSGEKTVGDLAPVLHVGGIGLRVVVVMLEPRLHLRLVETRHHLVDDVLKRLVQPATGNEGSVQCSVTSELVKHNNLFMLLKIF